MITKSEQRQDRIRGRRERRKLARQARFRRQVLRYCLLTCLLFLGASAFMFLPWRLGNNDQDIIVHGNQVVSAEQVRHVLSDCKGKVLWKLDPQTLATRVQSLEAVRYAFVRPYLFPHPLVVVDVLEEFPWASYAPEPDTANEQVIAESGRMIPISEFPNVIQPPLRIFARPGFTMTSTQVGQWAAWANYVASQTGQKIDWIDLRTDTDIRVQDGDLYLKLGACDSSLTHRLGRLASLMPSIGPFRDKLVYIDLSLENNIPVNVAHDAKAKHNIHLAGQSTQEPGAAAVAAATTGTADGAMPATTTANGVAPAP